MCHYCTQHGDGGKWFENATNFAAKMYSSRRNRTAKEAKEAAEEAQKMKFTQHMGTEAFKINPETGLMVKPPENPKPPVIIEDVKDGSGFKPEIKETRSHFQYYEDEKGNVRIPKDAPVDLDIMFTDLLKEVVDATGVDVSGKPALKRKVASFMGDYHFGQVVTLEEVLKMVELTYPIGLMQCICRRETRGMMAKGEANFCMSLGVGIYKWERWPETFRGLSFLSVKEAKDMLLHFNRKGYVHSLWTFNVPYIGGICNCEYPVCQGIRGRIDYGVDSIVLKGEYCAKPIIENCTGCGYCVRYCQFGAMSMNLSRNKVAIDMKRCFGCGQCEKHCPNSAISLVERRRTPGIADMW